MWIRGCDWHTRYQQIAAMDTTTGERVERRVEHHGGQVEQFYTAWPRPARIGIEATGTTQWFERLLARLGHELWVGDAATIRAAVVRQQKTDTRNAQHLLRLLLEERFPRIWIPSVEERDLRQLLRHRTKRVSRRTQVRNQWQWLALSQGLCRKKKLGTIPGRQELEALGLDRWAGERRRDLLVLLDSLDLSRPVSIPSGFHRDARIEPLNRKVSEEVERRPEAVRRMQQPGVGPVTALAFLLTLGPVERFRRSKQLVSYLGLNPRERSSGGRQRLGAISKQGNTLLRWLLVEAAQTAARLDPELHGDYVRLKFRRGARIAKVAIARKLAVRMYWMLRTPEKQAQRVSLPGSPKSSVVPHAGS